MKGTFKIPTYVTFLNWAVAVVLGSLFIPLTSAFSGRSTVLFNEEYVSMALSFAGVSTILSVPAVILLLISNIVLNKRELPKVKFLLIQHAVHFGVTVLTFGLIASFLESPSELEFVLPVALIYFSAGTLVWCISGFIFKEKQTTRSPHHNELIDEF